ncbi:MAG TPA: hypothetical protein VLH77_04870, partial [Gammaproteobacteria bacterium]|nr:hypothetical protein [Gammaproteobacteria bacterium]
IQFATTFTLAKIGEFAQESLVKFKNFVKRKTSNSDSDSRQKASSETFGTLSLKLDEPLSLSSEEEQLVSPRTREILKPKASELEISENSAPPKRLRSKKRREKKVVKEETIEAGLAIAEKKEQVEPTVEIQAEIASLPPIIRDDNASMANSASTAAIMQKMAQPSSPKIPVKVFMTKLNLAELTCETTEETTITPRTPAASVVTPHALEQTPRGVEQLFRSIMKPPTPKSPTAVAPQNGEPKPKSK